MDDFVLRSNPQYKHLFEDHVPEPKPDVHWLAPIETGAVMMRNSKCGQFQVRKSGDPPEYSLFSIRIPPFARLLKGGFKSFDEVKTFLQRSP